MVFLVEAYVNNRRQTFTIEAENAKEVPELLFERTGAGRTTILSVTPVRAARHAAAARLRRGRVGPKELELFCRQLQAMLSAGMTLLESLKTLEEQTASRKLKHALNDIAANVRSGFSFASSLKGHPDIFNPLFCSMVETAEESGRLEETLLRLADVLRRDQEFKGKLKQAMAYPLVVLSLAAAVVTGLFTFVVPKFTTLLAANDVPLPLLTRFMMAVAGHFVWIAAGAAAIAAGAAAAWRSVRKNENVSARVEALLLRVPVFGRIVCYLNLSQILWTLATLLRTGVNLVRSLDILAGATSYASLKREIALARLAVEKGDTLSAGFQGSMWLPPVERQMMAVGERSGNLDRMVEHAAGLLEKEAEMILGRIPSLMEAGITIAVGVGVLVVMLSLFLPIVSMYQTVK
ncbi:secretion system protein [Moorella sp. E308F]|uniref:type II secretion system F family protein n=1 Tax=unclassified Neomoorella TaxID=2676739 RepID=UPI0010FFBC47|nr:MULTISPECIES: type II secretion system F family protein [unclassified Moorella (in: firmicutes)]GEA15417.1 secretion system protein [Moorella sp. E308F]GEA19723.1 secretion system protein [Moorella sp. E306M]